MLALLSAALLLLPQTSTAAPAPRNVRGIHTLARESPAEIDRHLDWAQHLVGPGGYVTQPFAALGPLTDGPSPAAVYFVEQAYARGLQPIVRLQGEHASATGCNPLPYTGWIAPTADQAGQPLSYQAEAEGYRRFVAGLPRSEDQPLYIQVGNEPNLHEMWSGQADPREYARFYVEVANAIRALEEPRIKLLNAGLAPEGDLDNLEFIRAMLEAEPDFATSFDLWATHAYPHNLPPEANLHDGTAPAGTRYAIDAYLLELEVLRQAGVDTSRLEVILTETGYALGDQYFAGYPPIGEQNRADYIRRAYSQFWPRWPEVRAVTPFQLADPHGTWTSFSWVSTNSQSDPRGFPSQPSLQYAVQVPDAALVQGRLVDQFGNPLSAVSLTTEPNGHRAESGPDGTFLLMLLPGSYELHLMKPGYDTVSAAVSAAPGRVTSLDLTLTARLPSQLENGSFELGALHPWTTWGNVDGLQTGRWFLDAEPLEGHTFLGTAVNCGEKDGGVYQSIAVQPGSTVTLQAWTLTDLRGDSAVRTRVGIDPAGGTDPSAQQIEWSRWVETGGVWEPIALSAVVHAERLTVLLQHEQDPANAWNLAAFDDVRLVRSDPPHRE